ncbi:MAG: Asp23/Gls24 family envelope stress response protein [Lachnospiraceae bacterium]
MKNTSFDTHMGSIKIDKDVLAQYAGIIATECFGIVGMASVNVKDGIVQLLKKESMTRGIIVSVDNNKLSVDFHVIVGYGVSIAAVSDVLMETVKYKLEDYTGMQVDKVNVFVEGVRVID